MGVYRYSLKSGTIRWRVQFQYTDCQGLSQTYSKRGFLRQADAKEHEAEARAKLEGSTKMNFKSLTVLYLESLKIRVKDSTYQSACCMVKKLNEYFGKLDIQSINPRTIDSWKIYICNQESQLDGSKKLKPTYIKALSLRLNAILNYAMRIYGLKTNALKIAGPVGKLRADKRDIWTMEEFKQFAAAITDKFWRTVFNVLYFSGIREGELLALTAGDIDYENNCITVNKSAYYINGKGYVVTTPKTPKSNRKVELPKETMKILKSHCESIAGLTNESRLFVTSKWSLKRAIERYSNLAGVRVITIHDIRRSHCSLLAHLGINVIVARDRMGHESVNTTLEIYSIPYPEDAQSVAKALESIS